jgi:hypothetical protein
MAVLPGPWFNIITGFMSHLFFFSSIPRENFKKIFLSGNICNNDYQIVIKGRIGGKALLLTCWTRKIKNKKLLNK